MLDFIKKSIYWIIKPLDNKRFWCIITLYLQGTYKMCISNNYPCHARPTLVNINSDETFLHPNCKC